MAKRSAEFSKCSRSGLFAHRRTSPSAAAGGAPALKDILQSAPRRAPFSLPPPHVCLEPPSLGCPPGGAACEVSLARRTRPPVARRREREGAAEWNVLRLSRLLMMRLALPVSPQSVAPCLALARRLCGRAPRCGEGIRGLFALVAALRHLRAPWLRRGVPQQRGVHECWPSTAERCGSRPRCLRPSGPKVGDACGVRATPTAASERRIWRLALTLTQPPGGECCGPRRAPAPTDALRRVRCAALEGLRGEMRKHAGLAEEDKALDELRRLAARCGFLRMVRAGCECRRVRLARLAALGPAVRQGLPLFRPLACRRCSRQICQGNIFRGGII